jgi:hypothetical protein
MRFNPQPTNPDPQGDRGSIRSFPSRDHPRHQRSCPAGRHRAVSIEDRSGTASRSRDRGLCPPRSYRCRRAGGASGGDTPMPLNSLTPMQISRTPRWIMKRPVSGRAKLAGGNSGRDAVAGLTTWPIGHASVSSGRTRRAHQISAKSRSSRFRQGRRSDCTAKSSSCITARRRPATSTE